MSPQHSVALVFIAFLSVAGVADAQDKSNKDRKDNDILIGADTDCKSSDLAIQKKGFNALQDLASRGNADANQRLGECYALGIGVTANMRLAVRYYKQAAKAGNATAMHNLAVSFASGSGLPVDDKQAREWFFAAAKLGNSEAMCNYATFCRDGRGGEISTAEAFKWYSEASSIAIHWIAIHWGQTLFSVYKTRFVGPVSLGSDPVFCLQPVRCMVKYPYG